MSELDQETIDLKSLTFKRNSEPEMVNSTSDTASENFHPALVKFYASNPELKIMHSIVKNLEVPKNDTFIKPNVLNLGRTLDMAELILSEFCEENS